MDFVGGGSPLVIPAETTTPNEVEVPKESKSTLEEQEPPHVVKEIEDALETPLPQSALKFTAPERFAYAKQLYPASCIGEYKAILPNMAKKYPFELDGFQQAAVVCMEKGESVFCSYFSWKDRCGFV
ncbi:hypothetical protein RB195_013952 [Necator americanus]|uniref:Uncharacterized protein n=1 Tax=Necator americanus TaxID=51031 RepID=A0ABR1DXW9_NECAM